MHLSLEETKAQDEREWKWIISRKYNPAPYTVEANGSMDADNRNKPSKHFFKWRKQEKQLKYHMQYMTFLFFYIRAWISRESFITRQPKQKWLDRHIHWHCSARRPCCWKKYMKKSYLTNHRVALYHVKCIFVNSLALPLLESHL